jgi:hypothetical protein
MQRGLNMHPNARLIETLYGALRDDEPEAAAECYAADARFEDIAFRLEGRDQVLDMCASSAAGR